MFILDCNADESGFFGGASYIPKRSFHSRSPYLSSLEGSGLKAELGIYANRNLYLGAFYDKVDYDEKLCSFISARATLKLEETNIGGFMRYYFHKYIGMKLGIHKQILDRRMYDKVSGAEITDFSYDHKSSRLGLQLAGSLRYPISKIDLYSDFDYRYYSSGFKSSNFEIGIRILF